MKHFKDCSVSCTHTAHIVLCLRLHLQGLYHLKLIKPAPQHGHHRHHHTHVLLTCPHPCNTQFLHTPKHRSKATLVHTATPTPVSSQSAESTRPNGHAPHTRLSNSFPPAAPSLRGSAAPLLPPPWPRPRQPLPPASPTLPLVGGSWM